MKKVLTVLGLGVLGLSLLTGCNGEKVSVEGNDKGYTKEEVATGVYKYINEGTLYGEEGYKEYLGDKKGGNVRNVKDYEKYEMDKVYDEFEGIVKKDEKGKDLKTKDYGALIRAYGMMPEDDKRYAVMGEAIETLAKRNGKELKGSIYKQSKDVWKKVDKYKLYKNVGNYKKAEESYVAYSGLKEVYNKYNGLKEGDKVRDNIERTVDGYYDFGQQEYGESSKNAKKLKSEIKKYIDESYSELPTTKYQMY